MLYVNPVSPAISARAPEHTQRKAALQEFEHLFLYSLLREMKQTVSISGEKKGREMQLFEEMLDDALSGQMALSGQVGIARQIEQQLAARDRWPVAGDR